MSTLSTANITSKAANTPPVIKDVNGTECGTFCRAWVNFNGTGTIAIRDSFNVSSITDNGTGAYTVNFSTSMANSNYATVISAAYGASYNFAMPNTIGSGGYLADSTVNSHRFSVVVYNATAWSDSPHIHFAVFGG